MLLLTPEDVRRDLMGATGDDDMLPSAGTEGDTVRHSPNSRARATTA